MYEVGDYVSRDSGYGEESVLRPQRRSARPEGGTSMEVCRLSEAGNIQDNK